MAQQKSNDEHKNFTGTEPLIAQIDNDDDPLVVVGGGITVRLAHVPRRILKETHNAHNVVTRLTSDIKEGEIVVFT